MRAGHLSATSGAIGLSAAVALAIPASPARADEPVPLPVARVMLGPAFHLGAPDLVQFTMDVDAGVMVLAGKDRSFFFDAELGYTYDHIGLNAFNLAGMIGIGTDLIAYVAYQPRMLLGTADDGSFVGGMRNAIGGHFFFDLLDVEFGHQFLANRGELTHSLNLTFGMNPAAAIYVFARFLGSSWGR